MRKLLLGKDNTVCQAKKNKNKAVFWLQILSPTRISPLLCGILWGYGWLIRGDIREEGNALVCFWERRGKPYRRERAPRTEGKTLRTTGNCEEKVPFSPRQAWLCHHAELPCLWIPLCEQPCGLLPARLLCPWDSPGSNTGVGCHALLQEIFLTHRLNLCLLVFCPGKWVLNC